MPTICVLSEGSFLILSKLLLYIVVNALSVSVSACAAKKYNITKAPNAYVPHSHSHKNLLYLTPIMMYCKFITLTCTNLWYNCGSDAIVPHHISHTVGHWSPRSYYKFGKPWNLQFQVYIPWGPGS